MRKLLTWIAGCLGRNPFVEEREQAMRKSWTSTATQLNLNYSRGNTLCEDEIAGRIDGIRIAIYNESDFDVQKLVTVIRVFSEGIFPTWRNLGRTELLAAYDEAVQQCGAVPGATLSDEARAWLLGHRFGIGTEFVEGDLRYRQLYGMDNADNIILVVQAMVLTMRQLACHSQN